MGRGEVAYHLLRYHDNSLDGKSSVAMIEQVFERRTKKVDDEDIMKALLAEVIDIRDAGYRGGRGKLASCTSLTILTRLTATNENLVCTVFISKLRSIALPRFLDTNC